MAKEKKEEEVMKCEIIRETIERVTEDLENLEDGRKSFGEELKRGLERALGKDWALHDETRAFYNKAMAKFDEAKKVWATFLEELKEKEKVCVP